MRSTASPFVCFFGAGKICVEQKPSSAFSLAAIGAKKKLGKKKRQVYFALLRESEEGYAPSTAPPFEKGGRKLFYINSA